MKPSERCKRDADVMTLFRNAYVDLLNHARLDSDAYPVAVLRPRADHVTWQRKRAETAGAAGMAAEPYARHGGTVTFRNAAYVDRSVNLVANWELSLRDPRQLPPETLLSALDSAIARARQEAREASERERGLTGLIAAFLRWPSTLREAVGPGHAAQRRAAGAIGVAGQIVVGTVGGALAVGLAAGAVEIWKGVF